MKLLYYPGCTLKSAAKNLEISALAAAEALDIELVELPRWNCCGVVPSIVADDLMRHLAPIRNLIRVQEANRDGLVENDYRLVTLCPMCFNVLKASNMRVKENPEDLQKLNDFMYLEEDYEGNVEVLHFYEVLEQIGWDEVKSRVKKPLEGLRVAPYYGCMLIRPKEVGIDDPEEPRIGHRLLEALGAEPVTHPFATRCCGSFQTVPEKYSVAESTYDIVTMARKHGAEALMTSCPLCAFNLDARQKETMELHHDFQPMPVFYFSQLMALAFDLGEEKCGFEMNYIDPKPLLVEKNLL